MCEGTFYLEAAQTAITSNGGGGRVLIKTFMFFSSFFSTLAQMTL
jgi:hypothetical protein